jgi:ATP-binding cassette subfamily B protein
MNYALDAQKPEKTGAVTAIKRLWPFMREEKRTLIFAFIAIVANAALNLAAPALIGHAIDAYVIPKQYHGVLLISALLLGIYLTALVTQYLQTRLMGGVGQRVLYNLRDAIFAKLQALPVAFFNQNKAGDLISRINNDTDKLNQFFSQALVQFFGSIFIMLGAGVFLISLHPRLGLAALAPAALVVVLTRLLSPWVKRRNATSLKSTGGLSAEIQESLDNFKVIVAFNRRDFFRRRFEEANDDNYRAAVGAGLANNVFVPMYGFASHLAQMIVLGFGIFLIMQGSFTLGLLVSFLSYVNSFYTPMRQLAALWANFQVAMAAWDRISAILSMDSDLVSAEEAGTAASGPLVEFDGVHFTYVGGKEVLHKASFALERGKTYALVGPTGGGKTTTASLMARLYDPTEGVVRLDGRDIRSYTDAERTGKVGFILQEPFLFAGTVGENLIYGNERYEGRPKEDLAKVIHEIGLEGLLARFSQGLETPISGAQGLSLGQRQLIAFMRAVLREPEILILDEATANVDTVTEKLLEEILEKLPAKTTRVIIAHRLNTIENADEIFFVNASEIVRAGSMEHAVEMLLHGERKS